MASTTVLCGTLHFDLLVAQLCVFVYLLLNTFVSIHPKVSYIIHEHVKNNKSFMMAREGIQIVASGKT